jgi:phosphomannomutase
MPSLDTSSGDLRRRAERWLADDPDPATQDELRALLAAGNAAAAELADRFAGSLEFGTAGLRGVLGAGPNRMNRAVVLRTTHGLAQHLLRTVPGAAERGVVIGYDGRRGSRQLADDTALVLAAAGIRAHRFVHAVPTPVTAFAVKQLGAAAGVMVTASHNPPEYNGYKVYWENAAQIIPPTDAAIAALIEGAPVAREVDRLDEAEARAQGKLVDLGEATLGQYLDAVRELGVHTTGDRALRVVYTPLHGVGDALARAALARAGFTNVTSVPEQQEPDGAFPTVAFPNPEEKGAMDLALALGKRLGADLVLANDPDADRLAVAVAVAAAGAGAAPSGFVQLTGNQVGVLLGHYLLTEGAARDMRLVIASIVSSPMLGVIARALGVRYEETLTGFKWIANRAMDLERMGYRFVFGYEEALGYTVGDVVRDKDGISAAVLAAEIAAVLRARGRTLLDELESIARTYGLFVSMQVNVTKKGAAGAQEIAALMDRLRGAAPARIGEHEVESVCDYKTQTRTSRGGVKSALTLPTSNVLAFELAGGSRVIARPSGTEPKVKFYFDVCEPMAKGESMQGASARAERTMKALADAFVKLAG